MNTQEIIKEILRILTVGSYSKEVIDLLKTHLALLAEQNDQLSAKVASLTIENGQLRAERERSSPLRDMLPEQAVRILKLFFEAGNDLSIEQVSAHLNIQKAMVEHYSDTLRKGDFLRQTHAGIGGNDSGKYGLRPSGRAYVARLLND